MAKLLACLKPLTTDDDAGSTLRTTTNGSPDGYQSSAASSSHERRKVAYVELLRRSREPLGIGIEGGTDRHRPAHIAHLRPGGVADKSQALQTGDRILSINGTSTEHLMRSEIAALLDNAGNVVNLEIAYEASPDEEEDESGVLKKTAFLTLTRERNSFGFTISGGSKERRPITVSHVAVGSSAFRHGVLKAGDRVLQINGSDVTTVSQLEAVTLLQSSDDTCTLEIEYDITVHDELLESRGPLQVDLIKPKGACLGISLSGALHLGQPMYISKVKEAGIAERCGALHVRDQLVSINGVTLENKTIRDAVRLLARSDFNVRLEIIPAHNLTIVPDLSQEEALSDTLSRLSDPHTPHLPGRQSQLSVTSSGNGGHHMLCHPETMRVQLKSDDIGFGLSLHGGVSGKRYRPIKIAVIEDGGPAALAGVLQVGDRIVSLNGVNVDGVATAHQALKLVQEGGDVLDMEVIFDVTDAVVPTSGTFDVKMVKTSSLNLGITINGSDKREDNIWISSLKKGGIACRMGTLKPGDVILAINGQSMEDCNLREAAHALRNAGDVVTLTISKECSEKPTTGLTASEAVIFSVELHSDGLPLGISLTGSNHQPQPVFIARIAEGGVAHRTGALKVGDRIMAINGQSLFGKTLRDAVFMLQNAGDTVTLKISKLNRRKHSRPKAWSPTSKLYRQRYRGGNVSPPRRHTHHARLPRHVGGAGNMAIPSRFLGGGLHGRQPSSTTIASSVSGAGTPEIPERLPYLPRSVASSPRQQLSGDFGCEEHRRRYLLFSPSERSAFSRLPAVEDDEEEEPGERVALSRQRLFEGAAGATGGRSYQTPPPVGTSLSPVEALWERHRSLAERIALAETDEETGQEDEEVAAGDRFHYRRGSLPVHPLPHFYSGVDADGGPGRWNFKMRAMPLPVGRVSPLMSDHEHGGGRGGGKILAAQKDQDELGANRAATGTPPNKPSSVAGDFGSRTPQDKENVRELTESGEKRGEEEERGEGESASDEEDGEERVGVGATELESWEEGAEDTENGAKAVHTEHTSLPFPLVPAAGVLPDFPSPSSSHVKNTTSTSTPNSLSRPKPASITSRAKQRAPSVPALPTSLLASSVDPNNHPGLPECLGDYERTLHNARNYMREFKALAESGSSDQESDPEPTLSTKLKAAEIMEQISSAAKVPALIQHHLVTLHKESKETDLGFSLSDGLGEPGVYVKSIHSGGLAEKNGELQPFDRIMKINDEVVRDYDCCRVVPLLQELTSDVALLVARNSLSKSGQPATAAGSK